MAEMPSMKGGCKVKSFVFLGRRGCSWRRENMMNTGGICSKIIAVTRERGRGRTSDRMRTLYGDRWPRGEKGRAEGDRQPRGGKGRPQEKQS
jgi:hypothetical protein